MTDVSHCPSEEPVPFRTPFGDCDFEWENCVVLAAPAHLAPNTDNLGDPCALVGCDVPVMLISVRLWHKKLDVLADHLFRAVAKQEFSSTVERLNDPVLVNDCDFVNCRIDDGAILCLVLTAPLLRSLSFGEITDDFAE